MQDGKLIYMENKKKVSIAFYSSYAGKSWKAPRLERILPKLKEHLGCCYGLAYPKGYTQYNNRMYLSKLPIYGSLLTKKLSKLLGFPQYYSYLVGEYLVGLLYKNRVEKDKCDVVFCKPRPLSIIKSAKKTGKIVVIEASEMHPRHTEKVLKQEYKTFNIKHDSIYTNKFAIEEFEAAIEIADKLIVQGGAALRTYVENGVDLKKIKVITQAVPSVKAVNFDDSKPRAFISTASHTFYKGTHRLLLAWKEAAINDIPLLIVGELHEDIKEFIKLFGPFENAYFLGSKNVHELYQNYNAVGVLLSFSEGAPRAVVEYLKYGFPVIVSEAAACDYVINKHNGFIVNPYNIDEVVNKLKFFSLDYPLQMKLNAFETCNVRTLDDYASEVYDLLVNEL